MQKVDITISSILQQKKKKKKIAYVLTLRFVVRTFRQSAVSVKYLKTRILQIVSCKWPLKVFTK